MAQYRAECTDCDWAGNWKGSESEANTEGAAHESSKSGHDTQIHTEY